MVARTNLNRRFTSRCEQKPGGDSSGFFLAEIEKRGSEFQCSGYRFEFLTSAGVGDVSDVRNEEPSRSRNFSSDFIAENGKEGAA